MRAYPGQALLYAGRENPTKIVDGPVWVGSQEKIESLGTIDIREICIHLCRLFSNDLFGHSQRRLAKSRESISSGTDLEKGNVS